MDILWTFTLFQRSGYNISLTWPAIWVFRDVGFVGSDWSVVKDHRLSSMDSIETNIPTQDLVSRQEMFTIVMLPTLVLMDYLNISTTTI